MRAFWASVVVLAACGGTTFVGVSSDGGDTDGAAAGDGGSESGAGGDSSARQCPGIPNIGDGCNQDGDCTFGAERLDCCGSIRYVGFNQTFAAEFQTAESRLEATCGKCQCPPAAPVTQDGRVVLEVTKVIVRCNSHQCRTTTN